MKRQIKVKSNVRRKQNSKPWAWQSNMKRGKGSRNGWIYSANTQA